MRLENSLRRALVLVRCETGRPGVACAWKRSNCCMQFLWIRSLSYMTRHVDRRRKGEFFENLTQIDSWWHVMMWWMTFFDTQQRNVFRAFISNRVFSRVESYACKCFFMCLTAKLRVMEGRGRGLEPCQTIWHFSYLLLLLHVWHTFPLCSHWH